MIAALQERSGNTLLLHGISQQASQSVARYSAEKGNRSLEASEADSKIEL